MSKTLRILLLAAAGSLIGTAASANGYINRNWGGSIKDEMPPIMWTGLYVGGHLGYSFGSPNGSGEIEFEEPEPEGAEFQGSIDPQLEGSGTLRASYPDGTPMVEGRFVDGLPDGPWTRRAMRVRSPRCSARAVRSSTAGRR